MDSFGHFHTGSFFFQACRGRQNSIHHSAGLRISQQNNALLQSDQCVSFQLSVVLMLWVISVCVSSMVNFIKYVPQPTAESLMHCAIHQR